MTNLHSILRKVNANSGKLPELLTMQPYLKYMHTRLQIWGKTMRKALKLLYKMPVGLNLKICLFMKLHLCHSMFILGLKV